MIKYLIELKKYVQFSQNKGLPHILYYTFIHYCIVTYTMKTFIIIHHKTTKSGQLQETIVNTLRTGDADLRFYISTMQEG